MTNFPGITSVNKISLIRIFKQNQQQNIIIMSRSAKQNWFQSPHSKNGFWFFHQQKNDIFSFNKPSFLDRNLYLTPSRNSKSIEIQKSRITPNNHSSQMSQTDQSRFEDVNLPDMFSNTKIQKQIINQKISFEDSSVIQQQDDYITPQKHHAQSDQSFIKGKRYLADTTAKKSNFHYFEQKKTRPKQKGLRILSQKAYEIVLKMDGATYKQVANVLVDQLATQDNVQIDGKDQQNIKRRVYDALNVLIALGVLKKDGRKIYGIKQQKNEEQQIQNQIKSLKQQLSLKKICMLQKLKQQKSVAINYQIIKALIKRNKGCLNTDKQQKLHFPFIAINVCEQKEKNIHQKQQSFQIVSKQEKIEPFGDLDIICFLKNSLKNYIQ